jgi:hypothetical protein
MPTRCLDVTPSTTSGAGALGQPWITPENAASDDGALAVSSVDADAINADTATDYLVLPVSIAGASGGGAIVSYGLTLRAFSVGSKGSARIADLRFAAGSYTSADLSSNEPLTTTEQAFTFDLASAPARPKGADLASGGEWRVRFEAASGSCAIAVDALVSDAQACLERRDPGLLGRNFRSRNFRGR